MLHILPAVTLLLTNIAAIEPPQPRTFDQVYWSDGDSGRLNGNKFRLANVDAPETGGVGARGGAKCEAERELGFEAKAFLVELTRNKDLQVIASYGPDRYDREVVELAINGKPLADIAIEAGHLRPWPHKGRRALAKKPDWCAIAMGGDGTRAAP